MNQIEQRNCTQESFAMWEYTVEGGPSPKKHTGIVGWRSAKVYSSREIKMLFLNMQSLLCGECNRELGGALGKRASSETGLGVILREKGTF